MAIACYVSLSAGALAKARLWGKSSKNTTGRKRPTLEIFLL